MALIDNGIVVKVPAAELPTGYTKPTVVTFTDFEYSQINKIFTISKASVQNATAITTIANLLTALQVLIDAAITSDYNTSALTVTIYSELISIDNNHNLAGVEYTNGAINYVCAVNTYIKTA